MKCKVLAMAAMLALTAVPVQASECEDDLAAIDKAAASATLDSDKQAQLQDMRKQAQELCTAGNAEEALDVIAEIKAMLNIE